MRSRVFLLFFCFCFPVLPALAQSLSGRVADARSKQPVPFAIIKWDGGASGVVADVNGRFTIPADARALTVQSIGYLPQQITPGGPPLLILLAPAPAALGEVIVKPQRDKIRRILSAAIAQRNSNNPDKYPQYRCHVYYKMVADLQVPDSLLQDTAKDGLEAKQFLEGQHLLMTETYSIRTWQRPRQLQEEVLATRFSGLRNSEFTSLVTDILPFHSYSDFITVNGKDYHNPVSPGWAQHYRFRISDELVQDGDTVWALHFTPRNGQQELEGSVFVHSDGYAISSLTAGATDTVLHRTVRLEQQYEKNHGRWFPKELNYIFDWQMSTSGLSYTLHMKGSSRIDSVQYNLPPGFHFDKAHTVKLSPAAARLNDSGWALLRPQELDAKDRRTYVFDDSIGAAFHIDRYIGYLPKLLEAKFPLGPVDINLERFYTYNAYEKARLGLGLQTSEKLLRTASVGAWAGYGFGDKQWKWGAFTELYADRYKEKVLRMAYDNDLRDPGRLLIHPDLDKAYLRSFLMQRVDKTEAFTLTAKARTGYLSSALSLRHETIIPQYDYALAEGGTIHQRFVGNEAILMLRYVYGLRTAPAFGRYFDNARSGYPALYARLTAGKLEEQATPYYQLLLAADWQQHLNRIGQERIRLIAGKIWEETPLPLSKLFAGNGFRSDADMIFVFGGMLTMRPYEYYSDRFVNLYWQHSFDWKLYRWQARGKGLSSAPNIALQYNGLWGKLSNPGVHQGVSFTVPDPIYHEGGLMLQNVLRIAYLNLYYITLNAGYFYHFTPAAFDAKQNGVAVFGLGVEL